jgi:large subunit ribosomal protein L2
MAIKTYKPITPSLRQRITLIKPKSEIKLSNYLFADEDKYDIKAGRNNTGRITIRRRGGRSSHKRKLRKIDRGRELGQYSICKVIDIQYDPNITGNIALLEPIKEIERSNINIKKKE